MIGLLSFINYSMYRDKQQHFKICLGLGFLYQRYNC